MVWLFTSLPVIVFQYYTHLQSEGSLPGATTDIDDPQAGSSQNRWASQWYLGTQWVPHAEERLSILPAWFWSCFGPVVPGYVPIHCRLNSRQPWQPNGHPVLPLYAGNTKLVFACMRTPSWEVAQVSEETLQLRSDPVWGLLKTMRTFEVGLSAFCPMRRPWAYGDKG